MLLTRIHLVAREAAGELGVTFEQSAVPAKDYCVLNWSSRSILTKAELLQITGSPLPDPMKTDSYFWIISSLC